MSGYALVVFPIPLDKSFCYRVPEELEGKVRRGVRVIAPFGRRHEEGYVVETPDEPNYPEEELKQIIDCLDEKPFFSEEMLMLTRWMADRYLSSWGEALRCAAPYGTRAMINRYVMPKRDADLSPESLESLRKSAPRQHAILEQVISKGRISVSSLRRSLGSGGFYAALSALERKGLVLISHSVRPAREKRVRYVLLDVPRETAADQVESLVKRAPKAAQALHTLLDEGEMPLHDLMELSGTGRSSIELLERRGIVRIEYLEELRSPEEIWEDESHADGFELTEDQRRALERIAQTICADRHQVFLLHGVTGSGKTEVYMRAIEMALKRSKGVIVLVPEISLTPQTVARFTSRFGSRVAVLHSRLSPGERYDQWRLIREGEADIVVGPRSAVFAPIGSLGLIVIDEEHETSYKQSEPAPRYHAREVAIKRAQIAGCPVVMGTATPSLESYYMASTGRYVLLRMPKRVMDIDLPPIEVVDMRQELVGRKNRSIFSFRLRHRMAEALRKGHQVMLFLNRRGFSTYVFCRECGYVERCENCSVALTYHRTRNLMLCHHCGLERPVPKGCPRCKSPYIRHFGIGTQQVEAEVRKFFPKARVARMDSDAVSSKGAHSKILNAFRKGEVDVLVGTQMIAKGLDFPNVTLVGVVNADVALNFPDFRASERTFNLLTQVAGRSGRSKKGGTVIVQTYAPEHYSILAARNHDYESFYREEIAAREAVMYPPFTAAASVLVKGPDEEGVIQAAHGLADMMNDLKGKGFDEVDVIGPAPAPISRIRGKYRWHLLVKSPEREKLTAFLREAISRITPKLTGGMDVIVDVDPISLL
jgi:primosomal protein N' (replication factor Y)